MAVVSYDGQLNTNFLFSAIYNMIISQLVFADNLTGTYSMLVDEARVNGSMYGDTKLYYATDVLKSVAWEQDSETARNLLAVYRPKAPECQSITLDVFRQISLTVDDYMTKQAWADEYSFSNFNSIMQGWIGETKKIYDSTTYNTFIGTTYADAAGQTITITTPTQALTGAAPGTGQTEDQEYGLNKEATARLEAQTIAATLANIYIALEDVSRDWNDYGYMRSYSRDDFRLVWNADWFNIITNLDLPTIFHKDIISLGKYVLPSRYFGNVNPVTVTTADGLTIRSLIEQDISVSATVTKHLFAGELIPSGVTLASSGTIVYPSYTEDSKVVCKLVHKNDIPYMSGFEVGTSFFNEKNLSTNHYLTFGHNTLAHLYNYPLVTLKVDNEADAEVTSTDGE